MSFLVYPTIKEIPIRGLSGMGGGIFVSSRKATGGGGVDPGKIVVTSTNYASNTAVTGTYAVGGTTTLSIKGYGDTSATLDGLFNPSSNNYANDGYIRVNQGTTLSLRAWGAAGGSGNNSFLGYGGSGQYAESTIAFTEDATLYYMVGAGGGTGQPSTENASGGWGGGGSGGLEDEPTFNSGGPSIGRPGTAFGIGGDIDDEACGRGAISGAGGGTTALFLIHENNTSTADNDDAAASKILICAGAGGGYGGYSPGQNGRGGGNSGSNNATSTGVGPSLGDGQAGLTGAGGAGFQRGGGGGAGLYGGAGGNDKSYGDHPNEDQAGGGGGYGTTSAGASVNNVNISSGGLSASPAIGDGTVVNSGGTGHTGNYGNSNSQSQRAGFGGLLYMVVSET